MKYLMLFRGEREVHKYSSRGVFENYFKHEKFSCLSKHLYLSKYADDWSVLLKEHVVWSMNKGRLLLLNENVENFGLSRYSSEHKINILYHQRENRCFRLLCCMRVDNFSDFLKLILMVKNHWNFIN